MREAGVGGCEGGHPYAPSIEILPMSLKDIDEILRIEYQVYAWPWSRANFSDSLASGYSCQVCRLAGELIGYSVLMMIVDEAHLLTIGVAPAAATVSTAVNTSLVRTPRSSARVPARWMTGPSIIGSE